MNILQAQTTSDRKRALSKDATPLIARPPSMPIEASNLLAATAGQDVADVLALQRNERKAMRDEAKIAKGKGRGRGRGRSKQQPQQPAAAAPDREVASEPEKTDKRALDEAVDKVEEKPRKVSKKVPLAEARVSQACSITCLWNDGEDAFQITD